MYVSLILIINTYLLQLNQMTILEKSSIQQL